MHEAINRLIEWFRNPSVGRPDIFADDFRYTSQIGESDDGYWWRQVSDCGGWPDLSVVGLIAGPSSAAVFMEGTEQITLLRMRIAWWITGRDGKIASVLDVHSVLLTE